VIDLIVIKIVKVSDFRFLYLVNHFYKAHFGHQLFLISYKNIPYFILHIKSLLIFNF